MKHKYSFELLHLHNLQSFASALGTVRHLADGGGNVFVATSNNAVLALNTTTKLEHICIPVRFAAYLAIIICFSSRPTTNNHRRLMFRQNVHLFTAKMHTQIY
jgi:hypothetical protein